MPDTRPGSIFKDGICQACINYEKRKDINWAERQAELKALCDQYRGKGEYDCLIAVSGGKDSYFLVHTMKELGMNPLLITVTDSFTHTKAGIHNLRNLIEKFRCNHYQYTINHALFREMTRKDFEETGEPLKYIENFIYKIPTEFAKKFGIPLVIFGENSAYEYGTTDVDVKPELPLVYMSYYYPWSSMEHWELAKKYGFKSLGKEWKREGTIEDFEQIDSVAYMVHLWMKYPKYGFQRVSDIASRSIREGLLTKEKAEELIKEHDHKLDPKALRDFIKFCGYTKKEFFAIVDKFKKYE